MSHNRITLICHSLLQSFLKMTFIKKPRKQKHATKAPPQKNNAARIIVCCLITLPLVNSENSTFLCRLKRLTKPTNKEMDT